jgi:ribonuclease HII
MLVIGIDDAGRGPIIGPMILAGVLVTEEFEKELKIRGAKDSKLLTHPARIKIKGLIDEIVIASKAIITSAEAIDHSINSGINLNTLEAMKTAEIINHFNQGEYLSQPIRVIVDCPSVNIKSWTATLTSFINHPENLDIRCEHKADFNHPSVSAASIIAKVIREEEVTKLKAIYGKIGSGYPSDPDTKAFLREHGQEYKDVGLFRKTWQTWKALYPDNNQSTLNL